MEKKDIQKVERIFCIIVAVLFICSLVGTFRTMALFPTTCLLLSLELFSIWYIDKDNKDRKVKNYVLFISGIILVLVATLYTIIRTING